MHESFQSSQTMIQSLKPEVSVYCVCKPVLQARARLFLDNFGGHVLYAVKANSIELVVDALYEEGIRHFDTASIQEISSISDAYDGAHTYFMHPVKSSSAIKDSYHNYGVRHFVVDHADELEKVLSCLEGHAEGLILMVRISTPSKDATFNLSDKFGASIDDAIDLLKLVESRGAIPGLCFHVGSQCTTTQGHTAAFSTVKHILEKSGVRIKHLDVGGGFPVTYVGSSHPPLIDYLDCIKTGIQSLSLENDCTYMCEPGRSLVADGMSVVAQVQLRKGNSLYLNDGMYGSLGVTRLGLVLPYKTHRLTGDLSTKTVPMTIFGPTCDSLDILPYTMDLPADIAIGDWVEFGMLGAYGPAIRTSFNGFKPSTYCYVDEAFA